MSFFNVAKRCLKMDNRGRPAATKYTVLKECFIVQMLQRYQCIFVNSRCIILCIGNNTSIVIMQQFGSGINVGLSVSKRAVLTTRPAWSIFKHDMSQHSISRIVWLLEANPRLKLITNCYELDYKHDDAKLYGKGRPGFLPTIHTRILIPCYDQGNFIQVFQLYSLKIECSHFLLQV